MASGKSGSIWASLGLKTEEFQKGVNKAKGSMKGMESSMASFTKSMGGLMAGAFAVTEIIAFGKEASEMAGKLTGVEAAFKKIDNGGLFENLRKATKGTVNDLDLMQSAVQAENLGLPVEQLGTYFEFARRTAKATGESVDYLVDSIVKGVGRKSPLILDNLGISTSALNEQLKKTPDFATAVGIIIEQKMGKAGEDIDTAAERSAQFAAVWDNFKLGVGKGINEAMDSIIQSFADLWDVLSDLFAPIGELLSSFDSLNGEFSIGAMLGDILTMSVKALTMMLKPMVWIVQGLADAFKWLYENSTLFRQATDFIKQSINGVVKVFNNLGNIMLAIGNSFSHLFTAIKTMEFDGLGSKISGEFTKAFETKPVEKFEEAVKKETTTVKELTAEQLKALEELQKKRKDLYERWRKEDLNKAFLGTEEIKIDWNDFTLVGDKPKGLLDGIGDDIEMPDFDAEMDSQISTVKTKFDKMREMMASSSQAIYDTLENITVQGIATIGAAMGTAMAGGDFGGIIMGFAQMIGGAVSSLGQQLISLGVAELAIMDALKTFGASNPGLVIAGGVALVAIGAAMKSSMSESVGFADGGLVTGSVFANIGEGIGTNSANPEVIAPLDKLKNFINPDSGGMGGGNVSFRIEGNTLVGILDRQSKTTKYSR
jgi:hypothetical protein